MNKAQKYLIENNLNDIAVNALQYPENTKANANNWIYLSDILEQYLASNQGESLPIDSVVGTLFCEDCQKWVKKDCSCGNTDLKYDSTY